MSAEFNAPQLPDNNPPSYNTIVPYAPPVLQPPAASQDTVQIKGVPQGVELLTQINQLSVQEKFSVTQGRGRSFDVLDSVGQRVFQAKQYIQCCGPVYNIKLTDNWKRVTLDLTEECGCHCTRQVQVCGEGGRLLGSIKLHNNSLVTHLSMLDPRNQVILLIIGPSFQTNIFGNTTFQVKSSDEQHVVGMIKNENEQFFVSFPLDLEVTVKALLLGACFYLDALIHDKREELINRKSSD
ncbi:phospholipid scramblase 3-like [Pelodytes ibericus]